jgi:hypothetical protein
MKAMRNLYKTSFRETEETGREYFAVLGVTYMGAEY